MRRLLLPWCLLVSACITACRSQQVQPTEATLFPSATEDTWWLVNTVATDKAGIPQHQCWLMSTDGAGQQIYLSYYVSQWSGSDSAFQFASQRAVLEGLSTRQGFPMNLRLHDGSRWSWKMTRKRLLIHSDFKDTDSSGEQNQEMKLVYSKQDPFRVFHASKQAVWRLSPLTFHGAVRGKSQGKLRGTLFLSVIRDKQKLMQTAKKESVVWFDVLLQDGKTMSGLFTLNQVGELRMRSLQGFDQDGKGQELSQLAGMALDRAMEPKQVSGKQYPLEYQWYDSVTGRTCSFRPMRQQQEVFVKQGSFWMGAIEVVDSATGLKIGSGNMYIFTP